MATVEVTLTGDLADVVDQDFTRAQVRLLSNAPGFIADRDANKIRVLDEQWQDVAADGTFAFSNVVASTDTIVAGTLQYYVEVRVRLQREWKPLSLGPYVLDPSVTTVDVSDLEAQQPTALNRAIPDDINVDVLATAEQYTDDQIDAHEAAPNPHPQYIRSVDTLGNPLDRKFIFAGAGSQFPPVELNAILIYGGL